MNVVHTVMQPLCQNKLSLIVINSTKISNTINSHTLFNGFTYQCLQPKLSNAFEEPIIS